MAQNPAVQAFVAQMKTFVDAANTAVDGITGDVASLKAKLEAIQNSPGTLSPEDQASLDGALSDVNSLSTRLTALDAATPADVTPPA